MSDDALIPAADAWVWWNQSGGLVHDVRVLSYSATHTPEVLAIGLPERDADCDSGACWGYWRAGCPQPEALFGELAFLGFRSPRDLCAALVEFARIKECVWARQMVAEPTGFTLSPASSRRIRTWRRERAPCPLRETAARNFVNGTGAEADAVRRERPEPAP